MNTLYQQQMPLTKQYMMIRDEIIAVVNDDDLRFSPGGSNPPLGEVLRELHNVYEGYATSFESREFSVDYDASPGLAEEVSALKARSIELDRLLEEKIAALSEADLQNTVKRGPDVEIAIPRQLSALRETMVVYYAKLSVYLKAMNKTLPQILQLTIG